jgi:hypothetical protein
MIPTPFIRCSDMTKGLRVDLFTFDGTCSSQPIHSSLVHLVDIDMLATEGSPLDLKEVHGYLNEPRICEGDGTLKFTPAPLQKPHDFCNFHNNFTR